MAKRIRLIILIVVLGIAAVVLTIWLLARERARGKTLVLYGNAEIRQVDLAFNATQRIDEMLVEEGDMVRKGQLLGTVEKDKLSSAAAQAKAQFLTQKQVVSKLETGSRPQEIKKARADVAAAQARAQDAQITLKRTQQAVEQNAVSLQALDNARTRKNVADAELKAAQEALALVLEGPRREDIEAAKATMDAYYNEWQIANRNLADANLISPANGFIQDRVLQPGDMASPQTPAFILSLTDPIWVRVYVAEDDLGRIYPGMKAFAQTDSFPDKSYEGWIGFISPTAEFTPKTIETEDLRSNLVYQVRVFIKNPNNELRLGMPVTVKIDLDKQSD